LKRLLLAAISTIAMTVAASAADLAARPYTKAPPVAAAIYDWSGFYIGINGGGGSAHKCWDLTSLNFNGAVVPIVPALAEGCHNATGAIAGGQIGYRWQASNWVFGLEAQGDWANLTGSHQSNPGVFPFGTVVTDRTRVDAIGLFTGQIGYAWNNVLWYVKGGAAVSRDKYNGLVPATGIAFDEGTETRWGGAVGTGIEIGFAPNWSVGVEYNHLFMGTRNVTFSATGAFDPAGTFSRTDRISQDVDMGTVRLNYRFGGPVVAKY
jgi:outer membrane immunogenic protein